jgi:hypothetical protein
MAAAVRVPIVKRRQSSAVFAERVLECVDDAGAAIGAATNDSRNSEEARDGEGDETRLQ